MTLADQLDDAAAAANARGTEDTYLGPLTNKYALFHLTRADKVVNATAGAMGQRYRQLCAYVDSGAYQGPLFAWAATRLPNWITSWVQARQTRSGGTADEVLAGNPPPQVQPALLSTAAWKDVTRAEMLAVVPRPTELTAAADLRDREGDGGAMFDVAAAGGLRAFQVSDGGATAASATALALYLDVMGLKRRLRDFENIYARYYADCLAMHARGELVLPFSLGARVEEMAKNYRTERGILSPCTPRTAVALFNFQTKIQEQAEAFMRDRLTYAEKNLKNTPAYQAFLDQSQQELSDWLNGQVAEFNKAYEPMAREDLAGRVCAHHGFFVAAAQAPLVTVRA